MANKVAVQTGDFSASIWEQGIVTPELSTANQSVTTAGLFSAAFTAPNTTGKTTGMLWFQSVATVRDYQITLQEATVDTTCTATVLASDIKLGWNYVRFPVPYQWTATTANRYRFKIQSLVANSGQVALRAAASTITFFDTYDTLGTVGTTDDVFIFGANNSGVTPVTVTVTGTSNVCGSGGFKAGSSTSFLRQVGLAVEVGNGGTLIWDTTANATLQTRGVIEVRDGGQYIRNGSTSDRSIIARHVMDCEAANGNYFFNLSIGAKVEMKSGDLPTNRVRYVNGDGSGANPLIVDQATNWKVGDYITIGADDYNQVERKYIRTVVSPTSFTLSDTSGGAESPLSNSRSAGQVIVNRTRNSVVSPQNSTRSYWLTNYITNAADCDLTGCWFENPSLASGVGTITLTNNPTATGIFDYMLMTEGVSNRFGFSLSSNKDFKTITGLILDQVNSSNAGSGSLQLTSTANHTLNDVTLISGVSQGLNFDRSYNNTFNGLICNGMNTSNSSTGSGIYLTNSGTNTFNDVEIVGTRGRAILLNGNSDTEFNDSKFGVIGDNTIDIEVATDTSNTVLFSRSSFGSTTLISNYQNGLVGSDIAFQDMDGNESKHKWYTPRGSFWSSGAGLNDTTTRTPGSLALAIKPEDSSIGGQMTFKIPANPTSNVQVYGYIYRNATFSSGEIKAELFLPGTLLTDTPDDSFILPTSTLQWNLWTLNAYYDGGVSNDAARYAKVRITAKTATAGAYAFLDDIYDAQLNNKVAGMDLWDEGHISPIMLALDLSALPEQTRVAVWSDNNTYGQGSKGRIQSDTKLTNLLAMDKLS